ncbi:MAG: hypothetical protein U0984_03725 [Prosthecobacter sp.]|nr:hypothetical protein [Prosthecobacter sp.]
MKEALFLKLQSVGEMKVIRSGKAMASSTCTFDDVVNVRSI